MRAFILAVLIVLVQPETALSLIRAAVWAARPSAKYRPIVLLVFILASLYVHYIAKRRNRRST